MTDDLLERASTALREETRASSPDAALTRTRVMIGLHRQKQRKARLVVLLPLAAVLFGGTAWAAASGKLEAAWHVLKATVAEYSESAEKDGAGDPRPPKAASKHRLPKPNEPTVPPEPVALPTKAVLESETLVDEETLRVHPSSPDAAGMSASLAAHSKPEPSLPKRKTSHQGRGATPSSSRASADRDSDKARPVGEARSTSDTSPSVDAADRALAHAADAEAELARYRLAHGLHFEQRSAEAALKAWNDYLEHYPNGRFALEARYNRALCLVRLGRTDAAKAALTPFANGASGTYRQAEAKALLTALEQRPRP